MKNIESVTQQLQPLIDKIKYHSLYRQINSLATLRIFMEHHVFAVWDFMCLLKELHARIVLTRAPWFPPQDPNSAHLIGQILLEEEADRTEDGQGYCSHFELYLNAMKSIGANTDQIENFLQHLFQQETLIQAAIRSKLSAAVQQFIQTTFEFFSCETHILAAAFVYGREAITASMFTPLVYQIEQNMHPEQRSSIQPLLYYFKRHIELDGSQHFPQALQMLINLTGDQAKKWQEVARYAKVALQARCLFLDGIKHVIQKTDEITAGIVID
ncbi:MAG: DUF3050 domain-containing protein [Proteobacteria bacterium]|nr:DUF3050 domain-containing protein [Pseudomonadota bacterium]